jgi:hypothetical protein
VQWECFLAGSTEEISRPPPNQLPLANYSYQPLVGTLSVANLLVVFGQLLREGHVVLCSSYQSLLTPVAEALLSLLFPLQWQGMYIPVLPSAMHEVLDAPVPFFVGMDKRHVKQYLQRPDLVDVIFVDLDEDVVHMGKDNDGEPNTVLPALPDAIELKTLIEELVDHLYILPKCGIKGRMTAGSGETLLDNALREPYAQMTRIAKEAKRDHRRFILSLSERVLLEESTTRLTAQDFITTGQARLTRHRSNEKDYPELRDSASVVSSLKRKTRALQAHTDRLLAYAGQQFATANPFTASESERVLEEKKFEIGARFYDMDDKKNLPAREFRGAFQHYFVNLLLRYKRFLKLGHQGQVSLQKEAFIKDMQLPVKNRIYMEGVIGSQMFERFIHDRSKQKAFFDELIVAEKNKSLLLNNNKQPTPFLDDTRWKIRKNVEPPAPCSWGMWGGKVYKYDSFPKLTEEEFVSSTQTTWKAYYFGLLCCW